MVVTFDLPFPVSVNAMYANNSRAGRGRFKTKQYQEWIMEAGLKLNSQRVPTLRGKYFLSMTVERKDNRRRDIGNLTKCVEDLLVSQGVIDDDSKCEGYKEIIWDREGVINGCRVELRNA